MSEWLNKPSKECTNPLLVFHWFSKFWCSLQHSCVNWHFWCIRHQRLPTKNVIIVLSLYIRLQTVNFHRLNWVKWTPGRRTQMPGRMSLMLPGRQRRCSGKWVKSSSASIYSKYQFATLTNQLWHNNRNKECFFYVIKHVKIQFQHIVIEPRFDCSKDWGMHSNRFHGYIQQSVCIYIEKHFFTTQHSCKRLLFTILVLMHTRL